ncbi:hypothetical protein [Xanthobacter flavus]|uniref:hypothetical protein n=1 Tax=Xanthobacter flavus TaxID=281 RepID=UPI001AE2EA3D|nr:hypothetical protein [Xanthobacter flavus]MBP2147939.1 recombinational DNA repair ATPase RecF [Xanthobacter flavus]
MSVDPCAEAARLRALRTQIVTEGAVVRIKEGEREMQSTGPDLAKLDALIAEQDAACAAATGQRRTRFAKRMRFGCS